MRVHPLLHTYAYIYYNSNTTLSQMILLRGCHRPPGYPPSLSLPNHLNKYIYCLYLYLCVLSNHPCQRGCNWRRWCRHGSVVQARRRSDAVDWRRGHPPKHPASARARKLRLAVAIEAFFSRYGARSMEHPTQC